MKALWLENNQISLRDIPQPNKPNEALIKVRKAGICSTDLELVKGYYPYGKILLNRPRSSVDRVLVSEAEDRISSLRGGTLSNTQYPDQLHYSVSMETTPIRQTRTCLRNDYGFISMIAHGRAFDSRTKPDNKDEIYASINAALGALQGTE